MRNYFQWALILTLAFALAAFTAPVGFANGGGNDDDDDGGDECECEPCDGDNGDDDECDGDGGGSAQEFVVGNFKCNSETTLTFAGSLGVGSFAVTHPGASDPNSPSSFDPNSCAALGEALETTAEGAGCTSAGLVTPPTDPVPTPHAPSALSFICIGERNEIITTMGSLITQFVTFVPSGPMLFQPATHTQSTTNQGRRRR